MECRCVTRPGPAFVAAVLALSLGCGNSASVVGTDVPEDGDAPDLPGDPGLDAGDWGPDALDSPDPVADVDPDRDPGFESSDPGSDPGGQDLDSADPGSDPADPDSDPGDLDLDAADPDGNPGDPGGDPAGADSEPGEGNLDSADPAGDTGGDTGGDTADPDGAQVDPGGDPADLAPEDAPETAEEVPPDASCSPAIADGPSTGGNPSIEAGPGFSDVSPRQVVRSRANILYAIVPPCDQYPACTGNGLKAWRGDVPGTPTRFVEVDPAHAPTGTVGTSAVAIDGCDRIHVAWNQRDGTLRYAVLDATTDSWGTPTTVASTGWTDFGQGDEGVALALDASGVPHVAYTAVVGGAQRLRYVLRANGSWSAPQPVDDILLGTGQRSWHPALAFAPDGSLLLAWLVGYANYDPDGAIRVRTRSPQEVWLPSVPIPDTAMTAIDNGPSLLVTTDGVRHLSFCNSGNEFRYWYDAGSGFKGDRQPPVLISHNPSLGPDGHDGVHLYGHGVPTDGTIDGHGNNLYRFHRPRGGTWGPWTLYAKGSFDSSVTTRWAQFFHHYPLTLDVAYWNDSYPNTLFIGTE